MPCQHKFINYLNLERLDFEPTTLIVGTFNPAWPEGNRAEWFYGRTARNYFWDVLPRLYNGENYRKENSNCWKTFCKGNKIVLTDLITSINDAEVDNKEHQDILKSYLDTSIADYFDDFEFTDLKGILAKYPTIKNIYLTRNKGVELFDEEWQKVEDYVKNKPDYHVKNLLTPSASARFQIKEYKKEFPNDKTPLRNFIHREWKNQWHF